MKPRNVNEAMKGSLSEEEIKKLAKSFDTIGDIAIVEIPEGAEKNAQALAKAVMEVNKNIKVVLKKVGERGGEFRLRGYEHLAGENRTETIYREHGCLFKLDVNDVYFSPRESTERQRIAEMAKQGEKILVMFAGIGPFAIVLAKKSKATVTAVEINPSAVKYMEENIKLNKVQGKVTAILGDVKDVCKETNSFDRVLMPLPRGSREFLPFAISSLRKGGILHYYSWGSENDGLFEKPCQDIKRAAEEKGRNASIIGKRKTLPFSPRTWKLCIDAMIK